jgi:hypothetical protein
MMFQTILPCVLLLAVVFSSGVVVFASPPEELDTTDIVPRQRYLQPQMEALEAAKSLWESAARQGALSIDYTYAIGSDPFPIIVEVRNDTVTKAVMASYFLGQEGEPQELANFFTVEGSFELIQKSMETPEVSVDSVRYNPSYGYPTNIEITTSTESGSSSTSTTEYYNMESMMLLTVVNRDLNAAKLLWNSQNIADYDYIVQVFCFCDLDILEPHKIQVRDNVRIAATSQVTGRPSEHANLYPLVSGAFGIIETAIRQGYASVTASYDPDYGFPTKMSYDENVMLADDGSSYEFSAFVQNTQEVGFTRPPIFDDDSSRPPMTRPPIDSSTRPPMTRPPIDSSRPPIDSSRPPTTRPPIDSSRPSMTRSPMTRPPIDSSRPPIATRPPITPPPTESPSGSPSSTRTPAMDGTIINEVMSEPPNNDDGAVSGPPRTGFPITAPSTTPEESSSSNAPETVPPVEAPSGSPTLRSTTIAPITTTSAPVLDPTDAPETIASQLFDDAPSSAAPTPAASSPDESRNSETVLNESELNNDSAAATTTTGTSTWKMFSCYYLLLLSPLLVLL